MLSSKVRPTLVELVGRRRSDRAALRSMLLTLSLACQRARPSKFDPVARRLQHPANARQFAWRLM